MSTFKTITAFFLLPLMLISCSEQQKGTKAEFRWKIDKYVEFWNTGNFNDIHDILCEDFELRMTPQFESIPGIDSFMEEVTSWRKAYPDFNITIDETIYSNNALTLRWTITATNTGTGSHPPTGKRIKVPGMSIFHFANGKIKDEWIASNNYYWLKQLGFTLSPPSFENE